MRAVQRASHRLYRQPSAIGGETAGREMVETHAVLEVADGVPGLGVAVINMAWGRPRVPGSRRPGQ